MNLKWILICLLLFVPITILSAYFISISYEKLGIPNASFDVAKTHYKTESNYAPLLNEINKIIKPLGQPFYDIYFISLMLSTCFIIPFCLIHKLTNTLEYPVFFLYGTAIGVNHFVVGLIPQAILINFILLIGIKRSLTIPLLIISLYLHDFGWLFIILGYLFWTIKDNYGNNK